MKIKYPVNPVLIEYINKALGKAVYDKLEPEAAFSSCLKKQKLIN